MILSPECPGPQPRIRPDLSRSRAARPGAHMPPSMYESSNFSNSLVLSAFLILAIIMNIRGYLSLWLRISLMINDVKYLAKCLLAIHMYSFWKCLFTSFAIFFVFLLLDCAKCAMISIQLFYFKYFISSVLEIFFWFFFLQFSYCSWNFLSP